MSAPPTHPTARFDRCAMTRLAPAPLPRRHARARPVAPPARAARDPAARRHGRRGHRRSSRPGGDELRAIGPRTPEGRSLYFDAINAGKRSIRLDLKSAAGRAALLEHGRRRRRAGRIVPPGRDAAPRPRRRGAARRQPAPGLRRDVGLRTGRAAARRRRPRRQLSCRSTASSARRGRRAPLVPVPADRRLHGVDVRGLLDPRRAAGARARRPGLRDRPRARRRGDAVPALRARRARRARPRPEARGASC